MPFQSAGIRKIRQVVDNTKGHFSIKKRAIEEKKLIDNPYSTGIGKQYKFGENLNSFIFLAALGGY